MGRWVLQSFYAVYRQSPLEFPDSPDSTGHLKPGLPIWTLEAMFFLYRQKKLELCVTRFERSVPFSDKRYIRSKTRTHELSPTPRNAAELACFRLACCAGSPKGGNGRRRRSSAPMPARLHAPTAATSRRSPRSSCAGELEQSLQPPSPRWHCYFESCRFGAGSHRSSAVGDRACVLFWSQSAPLRLVGSRSRLFPDKSKLSSRR